MAGKEPVVAVEVEGGVLELAVDGLMEVFDECYAGGPGALEVGFDIIEKNCEALGCVAELRRALKAGLRPIDHDDGAAEVELGSADGVAVTVVLGESEVGGEPGDGGEEVAVDDVRQNRVDRNRAVVLHGVKVALEVWARQSGGGENSAGCAARSR